MRTLLLPHRWLPLALLAIACSQPPAPQVDPAIALVLDGIAISRAEVAQLRAVHRAIAPELGERTLTRYLLEEHVLPLQLARRAFAGRRAELLRQAQGLTSVATNASELEQRGATFFHQRKKVTRRQVEPPVAEFAFNPELTGSVSQPLEVPRGYVVAGCFDLTPSAIVAEDIVDVLQVGFLTHTTQEWREWWLSEQARVCDKLTYVHPDYREALPSWLKAP